MVTLASPAQATPRERQVTESLLNEGYTLAQSNIDSLLNMIERGYSWDSMDPLMAYHNLERFRPFSETTSLRILDLIKRNHNTPNSPVQIDRLMMALSDPPIRSQKFIEQLQELMHLLAPSETKRLAAVTLAHFSSARADAVKTLVELLDQLSGQSTLQVLTAYNLLAINEHPKEAEAKLAELLKHAPSAVVVIFYGAAVFPEQVSDFLYAKMNDSLTLLQEKDFKTAQYRIGEILKLRDESKSPSPSECPKYLDSKVIPFGTSHRLRSRQ